MVEKKLTKFNINVATNILGTRNVIAKQVREKAAAAEKAEEEKGSKT